MDERSSILDADARLRALRPVVAAGPRHGLHDRVPRRPQDAGSFNAHEKDQIGAFPYIWGMAGITYASMMKAETGTSHFRADSGSPIADQSNLENG